ncbi:MAG: hypothetical protein IKL66_01465 [Clostridia bacterium]|nr:hypothetical protein [Clostridia bacterium]
MMISTRAHKLIDLQEKTIKKEYLKDNLSALSEKNEDYKRTLSSLKAQAEKESADVLQLDKSSAKNTFLKITGQIDKKRLKETQEAEEVQEEYNRLLSEYNVFEKEYKSALREYRGLGNCDLDYLDLKTELFAEVKNDQSIDYRTKKLLEECEDLRKEVNARKAVIENVKELISSTEQILIDLEPAYRDAHIDSNSFQSRDIHHSISKYYHIDEIVPQIESLDIRLSEFSKNTKDFPPMCIISNLKYDALTKGADVLFEGPITMGIERTVLNDVENLVGEIKDINKKLNEILKTFLLIYDRKKSYMWRIELDLFRMLI